MNPAGQGTERMLRLIASAALIAANLAAAVVCLKDRWGFLQVLYFYWFEAIVIGGYNLLKMAVVCIWGEPFSNRLSFENRMAAMFWGFIGTVFFVFKFAGFALAVGFMLIMLPVGLNDLEAGRHVHTDPILMMRDTLDVVAESLPWLLLFVVISHGISFVVNFIGRREYRNSSLVVLLFWPYLRMAGVVGVLLLAGAVAAWLPALFRVPAYAMTVVLIKLLADLLSHRLIHSRKVAQQPPPILTTVGESV